MDKISYSNKLKDPRWQKKRLEIMQRDNWTCQDCGTDTSTLNVHHKYYEEGKEVWEYPDEALITICGDCHEYGHEMISIIMRILRRMSVEKIDLSASILYELSKSDTCTFRKAHSFPDSPDSTTK